MAKTIEEFVEGVSNLGGKIFGHKSAEESTLRSLGHAADWITKEYPALAETHVMAGKAEEFPRNIWPHKSPTVKGSYSSKHNYISIGTDRQNPRTAHHHWSVSSRGASFGGEDIGAASTLVHEYGHAAHSVISRRAAEMFPRLGTGAHEAVSRMLLPENVSRIVNSEYAATNPNEAFAEFFAHNLLEKRHPEFERIDQLIKGEKFNTRELLALGAEASSNKERIAAMADQTFDMGAPQAGYLSGGARAPRSYAGAGALIHKRNYSGRRDLSARDSQAQMLGRRRNSSGRRSDSSGATLVNMIQPNRSSGRF